jgi:hypothetical protein
MFRTSPEDNTPQPYNYYGQPGWYSLPRNWYVMSNPLNCSELVASPNSDFSKPVYYCTLSQDGINYVFQDTMRSIMDGTSGNNQG